MKLDKKVAIVTGAARGIGREYACCLAAAGASVVVVTGASVVVVTGASVVVVVSTTTHSPR